MIVFAEKGARSMREPAITVGKVAIYFNKAARKEISLLHVMIGIDKEKSRLIIRPTVQSYKGFKINKCGLVAGRGRPVAPGERARVWEGSLPALPAAGAARN